MFVLLAEGETVHHTNLLGWHLAGWLLIAAFGLFPLLQALLEAYRYRGERGILKHLGYGFKTVSPGGNWGQFSVLCMTVLIVGPVEIFLRTVTPLEGSIGSTAVALLPAVIVIFKQLDVLKEAGDRRVLLYSPFIAIGALNVVMISHVYAGTAEVGPAMFVINLVSALSQKAFNHQSGGSRSEEETISHGAHFHEEVEQLLANLRMRQYTETVTREIIQRLVKKQYSNVTQSGGLIDQALDLLYLDNREDPPELNRDEYHRRLISALAQMKSGHVKSKHRHRYHRHQHIHGLV